jgi:hypothetical protein
MKENHNIEELLNSFIDGELGPREQTEVQRLVANDTEIADRLRQLQKCRLMVSALPFDEAPAEIAQDIRAALERKTLLGATHSSFEQRRGELHLFMRKFAAAAAMFLLVAVLGAVVYMIVSPVDTKHKKVAVEKWRQPVTKIVAEKSEVREVAVNKPVAQPQVVLEKPVAKMEAFTGKVELKVRDVAAADAFIHRAFEDNGLKPQSSPVGTGRKVYSVNCSEQTLKSLLGQLKEIWNRFDSTRLLVDEKAVVNDVTAEQIYNIAEQGSLSEQITAAKNFAAFNSMNQRLPGREVMTAMDNKQDDLANIPKPVLASKEKVKEAAADEGAKRIRLTIVIMPTK